MQPLILYNTLSVKKHYHCFLGHAGRLGSEHLSVHAIDSSTIARLRANKQKCALLNKGYCHRARCTVCANIVAALTTVVLVEGERVGLVRRTRFGASCEETVAKIFATNQTAAVSYILERS